MRKMFQEELKQLHVQFYQMGLKVHEAVDASIQAYCQRDAIAANEVIKEDEYINQLEITIEHACFELIALQQPVSSDLRKIITIMKASADLERIGDHAVSISRATLRVIHEEKQFEIERDLCLVGKKVNQMLQDVLQAYIKTDEKEAILTAREDEEVDRITNEIHVSILKEMEQDSSKSLIASTNMMVTGYVERIGDYVTNLSEWIVYVATGDLTELNPQVSDRQ